MNIMAVVVFAPTSQTNAKDVRAWGGEGLDILPQPYSKAE
jgi:hypothetical protein